MAGVARLGRAWLGGLLWLGLLILRPSCVSDGVAWAAEAVLSGQPASEAGALIPAAKVPALVEELRAARQAAESLTALQEMLAAQTAHLDTVLAQVRTLEVANERLSAAVRIAEEIEALRQKQKDVAALVFERYERALTQADTALEKAQARIDGLERRAWWSQVLTVVGPLALLILFIF